MALAIRSNLLLKLTPVLLSVLFLALSPLTVKANESMAANEAFVRYGNPQALPEGQRAIAQAQQSGRGLNFVEVTDVQVVRILPDDTKGLQHQKWIVELENGQQVMVVYNSSICDRVPVEVGQKQSIGGQYIYDRSGGLLHWVHEDPRSRRPHGYVDAEGVRYGKVTRPNR